MNSIVWFPDLKDNSEINMNWSKKLSAEQKKSQALVFGIIDPSLSNREQHLYRSRFLQSNYSNENIFFSNYYPFEEIDKDLETRSIWKILEKVIAQYLLEHERCVLSTFYQNIFQATDIIIKIPDSNIKLGIDITCAEGNQEIIDYKLEKISRQAFFLNQTNTREYIFKKSYTSITKQPDLLWCINFYIPEKFQQIILNSFFDWKDNNYTGIWSDYIKDIWKINIFFHQIVKVIENLSIICNGKKPSSLKELEEKFDVFIQKDNQKINIQIFSKWNLNKKILDFYVLYTQFYYDKIDSNIQIHREKTPLPQHNPYKNNSWEKYHIPTPYYYFQIKEFEKTEDYFDPILKIYKFKKRIQKENQGLWYSLWDISSLTSHQISQLIK